jgi:hypothetical protein
LNYFRFGSDTKKIKIILFIFLFLTYSYFYQGGGHNSNTRINLTRAIVEQGRLMTDSFSGNTADVALYKGHTYCDKAPGTSLIGVIPFFVMTYLEKILPEGFVSKWGDHLRNHFTIALSVSLISAIGALFLFELLGFYTTKIIERLFVTIGYSIATPVFAYSTVFYGHQIAGTFLIIIFYIIHKIVLGEVRYDKESIYLFIAGILAGLTVLTEYPPAVVILFFSIFLFIKLINKWRIIYFIAGGLIIAVLLISYNMSCFDSLFSVGYSTYGSSENPNWQQMTKGVMGVQTPRPSVMYLLLFGTYRGLFYLSPFLLLSIPGFFFFFGLKEKRHLFYLSLLIVLYFISFNSGYGDSYVFWGGGVGMGPRHLIPMIPFLCIPVLLTMRRLKMFTIFLILLSIFFIIMGVSTEFRAPYNYTNPLVHYYMTNFFRGEMSKTIVSTFPSKFPNRDMEAYNLGEIAGLQGLWSLIPLALFWIVIASLFIYAVLPELEKPSKLFFLKTAAMVVFFVFGVFFLNDIFGLTNPKDISGGNGLLGRYYNNTDYRGEPSLKKVDKKIDFTWDMNTGRPFTDSFSVIWDGYVYIDKDGEYQFGINSDDGSMLYIDDKLLIDNGGMHGSRLFNEYVKLIKGFHKLQLKFQDFGGGAVMELYWVKPGEAQDIIDSKYLVVSIDNKKK